MGQAGIIVELNLPLHMRVHLLLSITLIELRCMLLAVGAVVRSHASQMPREAVMLGQHGLAIWCLMARMILLEHAVLHLSLNMSSCLLLLLQGLLVLLLVVSHELLSLAAWAAVDPAILARAIRRIEHRVSWQSRVGDDDVELCKDDQTRRDAWWSSALRWLGCVRSWRLSIRVRW
jgi:hypothetical protein